MAENKLSVGGYLLGEVIGHGNAGSLYRTSGPDGQPVALLLVNPQLIAEQVASSVFQEKRTSLAQLQHPHAVRLLAAGEEAGVHYLVFSWVVGETLAAKLSHLTQGDQSVDTERPKRRGARQVKDPVVNLPPAQVITLLRDIAGVLGEIHRLDLGPAIATPHNLILQPDGSTILVDLGAPGGPFALSNLIFATDQPTGNAPYRAPEHAQRSTVQDLRNDLYSLGVVAYQALTGRLPFPGPSAAAYARQHRNQLPTPVHTVNPAVPEELSQVVDRLLAKKPSDRYQDVAELVADLELVAQGFPPQIIYVPVLRTRRHWGPILRKAALIVGSAVFLVFAWFWWQGRLHVANAHRLMAEEQYSAAMHELDDVWPRTKAVNDLRESARTAKVLADKYIKQTGNTSAMAQDANSMEMVGQRSLRYKTNMNRGMSYLHGRQWREAEVAFRQALSIIGHEDEPRARELLAKAQVNGFLDGCRTAAATGQWEQVMVLAQRALALDPANEAARAMMAKARKTPQPALYVTTYVQGVEVKGASIYVDQQKQEVLTPAVLSLPPASTYRLHVALPPQADGRSFVAYDAPVTLTTGGLRELRVFMAYASSPPDIVPVPGATLAPLAGLAEGSAAAQEQQVRQAETAGASIEAVTRQSGIHLRLVPRGSFLMGSAADEPGHEEDETQHRVTISHSFYLGMYDITQEQWALVMKKSTARFGSAGANAPMETVSSEQVSAFLTALNKLEEVPDDTYRLPTEAEWEYACRAGTTTPTYLPQVTLQGKNNSPELDTIAWYGGNSGVTYNNAWSSKRWPEKQYSHEFAGIHPVGLKRPNAWGLYDMLGNVWQWTDDWYWPYAGASDQSQVDPPGGAWSTHRVVRGGAWNRGVLMLRAANRFGFRSDLPGNFTVGFRIARAVQLPTPIANPGGLAPIIVGPEGSKNTPLIQSQFAHYQANYLKPILASSASLIVPSSNFVLPGPQPLPPGSLYSAPMGAVPSQSATALPAIPPRSTAIPAGTTKPAAGAINPSGRPPAEVVDPARSPLAPPNLPPAH